MRKWFLILVVLVGVTGLIWILFRPRQLLSSVPETISQALPIITPTSMPFAELTIPYLRQRQYISSLADLKMASENSEYISYTTSYTSDGLKINALITKPKSEVPAGGWPAVVFVHGYIPPAQYRTTQNYNSYVDYLARRGLVVFKIDLRGHDQSEGEAGGGYYSGDYVIDVLNARAALQTSGFVSPSQIGLWGHSMAGNVVMRSLAAQPEISAVVIWAGAVYSYTDLAKYGIDDNSYQPPSQNTERARKRQELFDTYGAFDPQSEFWKQVAPTNYLQDIKGAVQIHHATDDPVVDVQFSQDLISLLDNTGILNELHEYSSGGHNLTGASFTTAMQRTVDFFKRNL